jgi:nicotinamidase-related amidase
MNSVIDIRAYVNSGLLPTLVLVDLQQEYVAPPRLLALADPTPALANCRAALIHARAMGFPVAFVRRLENAPLFNPATRFARWIEGFEPTGADMVFERSQPSCYASAEFAEVMSSGGGHFVLAGFAGESACLSTAIEAFHRGHRVTFLADASASHSLGDIDAEAMHHAVEKIIGVYGGVAETSMWIAHSSRRTALRGWEHEHEQGQTA